MADYAQPSALGTDPSMATATPSTPADAAAESRICCVPTSATNVNVGEGERIVSILGGAMLGILAMKSRSALRWVLLALGGSLLYRGLTGRCYGYQSLGVDTSHRNQHGVASGRGVHVQHTVVIQRAPAELFDTWKHLDRLPQMLSHLVEVRGLGENRTRWVARTPFGVTLRWNAQSIVRDDARTISWRSEPGSPLQTAGTIRFDQAPVGDGTEVHVSMDYDIPGGAAAEHVAEWFHVGLEDCVKNDLDEFKRRCEAG